MSRRRHINSAGSAPGRRSAAHRSCDDAPIAPRHETAKRIVSACSKNTVYHMTWASRCGALFIDGESSGPAFSHGWFPARLKIVAWFDLESRIFAPNHHSTALS
jgi:hypothetical protein